MACIHALFVVEVLMKPNLILPKSLLPVAPIITSILPSLLLWLSDLAYENLMGNC